MIGPPPMCMWCKRLDKDGPGCEAFPDGIPDEILDNQVDHRKPVDGDRGLQFKPKSKDVRPQPWWPGEAS